MKLFDDPDFWEREWKKVRENSLSAYRQESRSGRDYWNRRAAGFAENMLSANRRQRVSQVLHQISHHCRLDGDSRVLDIGCGPGDFVLPLSRRASRVVALDVAEEMLALVQGRMEEEGIENFELHQADWEGLDLLEQGWEKSFDLVMAVMSPGVKDAAGVRKMLTASRGSCYLAGYVNRERTGQRELWKELLGGEIPEGSQDILYIFHLLLAWGYYPSLDLEEQHRERELEPDQAVRELEDFFYPYLEITSEVQRTIENYVQKNLTGGLFKEELHYVTGSLIWQVEGKGLR